MTLPPCKHRGNVLTTKCFCRYPVKPNIVPHADCNGCQFNKAIPQSAEPKCEYRTEQIGSLWCSCPHTRGKSIFHCQKLNSPCLLQLDQLGEAANPKNGVKFKICETCEECKISRFEPKRLAVVNAIFNPTRSTRIIENYHRFKESLGAVEMTTVELTFDGQSPQIPSMHIEGDSRVHTLWQKERLINIGLKSLESDVDAVAWIDPDVVCRSGEWLERTIDALRDFPVVQMFRDVAWLDSDGHTERMFPSHVAKRNGKGVKGWGHTGFAWAARRSFLADGLFDAEITGGADVMLAEAFDGNLDHRRISQAPPGLRSAFCRWANGKRTRVGFVDVEIEHLFHGTWSDRQYNPRAAWLAEHDFDPAVDIQLDELDLWRWSPMVDPELRRKVENYFPGRRDG